MMCPKCTCRMLRLKKNWYCEECDYKQLFGQAVKIDVDKLFFADSFDAYYPLLAHEYHVLYDFVQNRSYYGAIMQYKDVVEIVLKFPTLVAINQLWHQVDYDLTEGSEEKRILDLLLGKPLSLGDWKEICRLFIERYKKNNKSDPILKPLLEAVNKFYDKEKIVYWRNERIGHGALQANLETDQNFINEFSSKLASLKNHMETNRHIYDKFEVLDETGNLISGKDQSLHKGNLLKIRLGETIHDQMPFILIKDQATKIFDSYLKESVYVLNYINGSRTKHKDEIATIFAEKRKLVFSNESMQGLEKSASKLNDDVFVRKEIEMLNLMADEKNAFTKPEYIINDVKQFLDENKKGIMFLQMERGVGKTTFVRALDQLAMGNLRIADDIAVRAYYINNTFSYRINHFQNESVSILTNAKNYGIAEGLMLSNIPTNFIDMEDMATAFADFLNNMLHVYRQFTPAHRLLYIVDGLDEVRFDGADKRTIFDCIPHSELLADGVYIIMTGRHSYETAEWIQEKYSSFDGKAIKEKLYHSTDEHNKYTLECYLTKQLYKKTLDDISPEEKGVIESVIIKGDNRFLYVKALAELLKVDTFDINAISDKSVLERYLGVLEQKYGRGKHFQKIKRLLIIVALLDMPITVEELSYLYSFEPANLEFAGFITDLKGLLRIDRTGDGDAISGGIGTLHEDWKHHLINQAQPQLEGIITNWVEDIVSKTELHTNGDASVIENISDGEIYLVAYIFDIIKNHHPNQLDADIFNYEVKEFMLEVAKKANKTISGAEKSERICTSVISIAGDVAQHAFAHRDRGQYRCALIKLDDSLSDFNKAIDMLESFQKDDNIRLDMNYGASFYSGRGSTHHLMGNYEEALDDYNKCIDILEDLQEKGELTREYDLVHAHIGIGDVFSAMAYHDDALIYFSSSIEINERLQKEGKPYYIEDLPQAYMKRATMYTLMDNYELAMPDINKSIEIFEDLREEHNSLHGEELAKAYGLRGGTYLKMGDYESAISDLSKSIEIMEHLQKEGKLYDKEKLALEYLSRADANFFAGNHEAAYPEYSKAIDILESLHEKGMLYDKNTLAFMYGKKGWVYLAMKNSKEALAYLKKAINILEHLDEEGKLYDTEFLGTLYAAGSIAMLGD